MSGVVAGPVWTARAAPGWQVGLVWTAMTVFALGALVSLPFALHPDGHPSVLVLTTVLVLLVALFASIARTVAVELRIDLHAIVATRILGRPVRVERAAVRDVVAATAFLQPQRYGPPLRSLRVLVVGHDGRSLLGATWTSLPFDPPAFFAMWRMRPHLLADELWARDLERIVPGSTTGLERLGRGMLLAIPVLLGVEAFVVGIAFLLRAAIP